MSVRIPLDRAAIASFCRRWSIAELAFFGSVLRDDFGPASDVDVLVTFAPAAAWSLLDHAVMEEKLSSILGRRADIVSRRAIEGSHNWIRRAAILDSAEPYDPSRDEAALLDALRASRLALEFVGGYGSCRVSRRHQDAVGGAASVARDGESVKRLSPAAKAADPEVPWKPMAGMRDRLIHGHDAMDLDEVWRTVSVDRVGLITRLEALAPRGR